MSGLLSKNKIALYGAGAVAVGLAVWFLLRDEEPIEFDSTKHSLEQLRKMVNEIYVETSILYCQKLRLIRESIEDKKFVGDQTIQELIYRQQKDVEEQELLIYKDYGVDEDFALEWCKQYQDDPYISERLGKLQELHEMVFEENGKGKMEHLKTKMMPTGMTEDKYIFIYRKQQMIFRHEIYYKMDIISTCKDSEKIKALFDDIFDRKQQFQQKALSLYDVVQHPDDSRQVSKMLRDVYLDYNSKSLSESSINPNTVLFSKQIQLELKEHDEIMDDIMNNKPVDSYMDKYEAKNGDPRIDPMSIKETKRTSKQRKLLNITECGMCTDGQYSNREHTKKKKEDGESSGFNTDSDWEDIEDKMDKKESGLSTQDTGRVDSGAPQKRDSLQSMLSLEKRKKLGVSEQPELTTTTNNNVLFEGNNYELVD